MTDIDKLGEEVAAQIKSAEADRVKIAPGLRRVWAELEAKKDVPIRFKVTEKGGVSVYGLGRFPVTLYQGQWKKLLAAMPELEKFIEEHRHELSTKD